MSQRQARFKQTGHWIFLLILMGMAVELYAGRSFRFRQISREQGLSQSTVYCMLQDRLGFMWFGTNDGLNQYDGYKFQLYRYNPENPQSLSHNRILALYEDREGNLWIGTDGGGLNLLNRAANNFTSFKRDKDVEGSLSHDRVRALLEDREGNLWVGTGGGGLNRMNPDKSFKVFRRSSSKPGTLSHNRVRVLFESKDGTLWVGTGGGGLNRFDPKTEQFYYHKHQGNNPKSLSDNQINTIFEDSAGNLWIGTYSGGLNRFDPEREEFLHYRNDPDDFHSLISDTVNAIYEDADGHLWIATDNGLDRFDWDSQTFTHFRNDPLQSESLSDNEVLSLYQDRSEVFWVGTRNGGINKFERGRQTFNLYRNHPDNIASLADNRVNAVYQDRQNKVWVGFNGGGLDRMDPDASSFRHHRHRPGDSTSLSDNQVLSIRGDSQDRLWIGTHGGGLNLLRPGSDAFTHFRNDPDQPGSLISDVVWSLWVDHLGRLWVGTSLGLDLLQEATGDFRHYSHDAAVPQSLSDNVVWCLYESEDGTLWVGTENGGLNRMQEDGKGFDRFVRDETDAGSLSHNTVISLFETKDHHVWVGTWGGGLNRLDPQSGRFTHYRERDGLPNNVVYGILGDDRGNLWLSTNRGLANFNPETGAFRNYGVNDGLQGMEFNPGACFQGPNGEMFFGGNNGLNSFHPDNFRENGHTPPVLITAFRKFDEVIARDIHGELDVELSHEDNYLSFDFVALDFHNPEQNRYAYQMEGVDKSWLDGSGRSAQYRKLEPGNYTFRVKGSNNDNVWNEDGVAVKIRIIPPFHRTTFFYILCVLGIFGVFLGIVFFQRLQLKQQEAKALVALELKRKTEELEAARRLQLSMLPAQVPKLPTLEIAVLMETATEVGGDYYDFHESEDGSLTIAIGDATGHGIQAGTLVAAAKGVFLSLVGEYSPLEFLTRGSRILRRMGFRKMFMAMAIAHFDKRHMTLAVAGMPPAFIYRAQTGELQTVLIKGMPLGGLKYPYKQRSFDLHAGDVVLLTSDGLEEMFNESNRMLGTKRVREAFHKVATEPPQKIITSLRELGHEWSGSRPQADDVTLMVIKVK